MSHQATDTIYIELKGAWPASLFTEVREAIEVFFDLRGHDGLGETELDENGLAYAYDTDVRDEQGLAQLLEVLDKGPAWIMRFDEDDETAVTNLVSGPGLASHTRFNGDLEDPPVPLSRVEDKPHLAQLRAAVAINAMSFEVTPD